jgi:hypothetical protein
MGIKQLVFLVKSNGSVFAFDTEFVLLGEYRTQYEAVRAVEAWLRGLSVVPGDDAGKSA